MVFSGLLFVTVYMNNPQAVGWSLVKPGIVIDKGDGVPILKVVGSVTVEG